MVTNVITLNPESILTFAQHLCPKIARLVTRGSAHEPFIFETKRGARIIAPAFHFGQRFGFRSFLQVTGPNPRYLCNGQPSTNTKCLEFFGEGGPALEYRDSQFEPEVTALEALESPKEVISYLAQNLPLDYDQTSAIASVLKSQRIPVEKGVPLVVDALGGLDGLPTLRQAYKANAPLLRALQLQDIAISACLVQWRNCEYPQSIARELLAAGFSAENAAQLIETAYEKSDNYPLDNYRDVLTSVLSETSCS